MTLLLRFFGHEYCVKVLGNTACIPIEVFSSLPNLYLKAKNALYNPKNAAEFLRCLVINYPDVSVEQKNK